ncbi:hypothetical protein BCR33DRAFT_723367 [Rhizoclosmatium globosum]|uniref:Uncharacterized protein n=1 Tax=Rhizoclosmatium globosum TaxID=329046 RepID=A0A1Y2BCY8_9FUNG|nr:hypothetical protein BCR33DRAFT_723367 [Rhizoclosmatium globosum]|eukprot:ORY32702.1 hypothetical protein BCR33DRAFT_723367 [Rhizoclosmatium globosum]
MITALYRTHDLRKHRLRHHSADGTREKSTVDTVAEVQKRNLNLNLNPTCTQLNTPQTPKALAFPSLLPVQSQEPPRANSQTAQRLHNPYFLHQSQHSYQPYAVPRQVHSNEQFLVENRVGWLQTRHQSQRRTIFEPQFCQLPPNYVPDNAFDQRAGRRVKYVPIMLPPSPQRRPEYQRPVYMSYREFVIDQ